MGGAIITSAPSPDLPPFCLIPTEPGNDIVPSLIRLDLNEKESAYGFIIMCGTTCHFGPPVLILLHRSAAKTGASGF